MSSMAPLLSFSGNADSNFSKRQSKEQQCSALKKKVISNCQIARYAYFTFSRYMSISDLTEGDGKTSKNLDGPRRPKGNMYM